MAGTLQNLAYSALCKHDLLSSHRSVVLAPVYLIKGFLCSLKLSLKFSLEKVCSCASSPKLKLAQVHVKLVRSSLGAGIM